MAASSGASGVAHVGVEVGDVDARPTSAASTCARSSHLDRRRVGVAADATARHGHM